MIADRIQSYWHTLVAALVLAPVLASSLDAQSFKRGEVNQDNEYNISDPVALLEFLFSGTFAVGCRDSADTDDNGVLELTDAVRSLEFLFLGGLPPNAPFAACGADPTNDSLECNSFAACDDGGPGPVVGTEVAVVTLQRSVFANCAGGQNTEFLSFPLSAAFLQVESESPDCEETVQTIGDCTITTTTCCSGPGNSTQAGFDPGNPGVASNGLGAMVNLERGDANISPILKYSFNPPAGTDLAQLGFDECQTLTVEFPGGDDIAAFTGSVDLPPDLKNVTPTSCDLTLSPPGDIKVTWTPSPKFPGLVVVTLTRSLSTTEACGFRSHSVAIRCEFPDAGGMGTIPAAAVALLPTDPGGGATISTAMTVSRENSVEVPVTRKNSEAPAKVTFSAASRVALNAF